MTVSDPLAEMEEDVFDVLDWSEVIHMAAANIDQPEQRNAIQTVARTVNGIGVRLRERWRAARDVQREGRQCA